jgi:DUF2075 family protein
MIDFTMYDEGKDVVVEQISKHNDEDLFVVRFKKGVHNNKETFKQLLKLDADIYLAEYMDKLREE